MEFLLSSTIFATAFMFSFLLFLYNFVWTSGYKRKIAPEAAGAWPIIGHLRLLGGPEQPYVVLGALADKYGPIFTIRLGMRRALVVSSWEMAKECFTGTNDKAFSNRLKSIALEHMTYNYAAFGLSPYGPFWREMRKIVTVELLSNHQLTMLSHVYESEVMASIKEIHELWIKNKNKSCSDEVLVEMKRWFQGITFSLTVRVLVGKQYENTRTKSNEIEKGHKTVREFFELMGVVTVADALPFLRGLNLGGYEKTVKKTAKKIDDMLQEWLEEHKQRKNYEEAKEEKYFMNKLLSILDGGHNIPNFDDDTIIKATCLSLILGGTDTTTLTVTWALALLLNNKPALKKVQEELEIHVGREKRVEISDIKNLVYIKATVKETLRLYPPTQILSPRMTTEDCNVGGYHVYAGTYLFVNLRRIHQDPRVWHDPGEFRPERFLTTHKDVDVRGKHFELIPFGSGRRVCPAISFALQAVELMLASLLHAFEITTPSDVPVDMTESFGIGSIIKVTPFEVLLTPRLPQLYG